MRNRTNLDRLWSVIGCLNLIKLILQGEETMGINLKQPLNKYIVIAVIILSLILILLWYLNRQPSENFRIISETISQPINHSEADGATFKQRIKILIPDSIISNPSVFFILGNESAINDDTIKTCFNMYGKRNDIMFILAEHRGYGKSVSLDEDQTVPKYVKVDQALADFHVVAEKYHSIYPGPWIVGGYSYGGGLSINYGYKYPNDASVILSSSGVVDWSFLLDSYENQAKENLGSGLYKRLVKHIDNLTPTQPFDQKWKDRELIYSFVSGISQYESYNKSSKKYLEALSKLPTGKFIHALKILDKLGAKGAAGDYVASNSKLNLSRTEALSCKYGWRVWRYQQFTQTGTLWSSTQPNGLYRNSNNDWIKECKLLFGEEPPLLKKDEWNVKDMVDKLKIPLIYVSGGKDPWKNVCLPKDYKLKNGRYFYFKDSFHCPDREEVNGVKVINEVLKYINK